MTVTAEAAVGAAMMVAVTAPPATMTARCQRRELALHESTSSFLVIHYM